MKTVAIIPTKFPTTLFYDLIDTLDMSEVDEIFILNNGDMKLPTDSWFHVEDATNLTIYQMWNRGLDIAQRLGVNALILNDDIAFKPHAVSVLSMYLERDKSLGIVFPDYDAIEDTGNYSLRYTETTAGAGGMAGYCFMVRKDLRVRVDENLGLYWGDDDLVKQVLEQRYKIARVVGLPVQHAGSLTIRSLDQEKVRQIMEADRAYFNQKYGENRSPVV